MTHCSPVDGVGAAKRESGNRSRCCQLKNKSTKAYVQNLAEGQAVELSGSGVDVLAVCPGPTQTGFSDRARMKMGKAASPADVVGASLKALGYKSTILPGFLAKLITYSLATLPRSARAKIIGKVMQGIASR